MMTDDLLGLTCEALILQQFWLKDKLVSEVNMLHFKATCGRCYGIYLNDEDYKWKVVPEEGLPTDLGFDEFRYPLIDLTDRYRLHSQSVISCEQELIFAHNVTFVIMFRNLSKVVLCHEFATEQETIELVAE